MFLGLAAPYVRDEVRAQAALSGYALSGPARAMFDVEVPERVSMEIAELAANTDGEGSDGYLIDTLFGLLDEFDEKDSREVTVFYGAYIHGAGDESIGELLGLSQPQCARDPRPRCCESCGKRTRNTSNCYDIVSNR